MRPGSASGSPFSDLKVPDLQALGFQLVGGRLLPVDGRPGAMFMYEDQGGERLTVLRRAATPDNRTTSFRFAARRQGRNLLLDRRRTRLCRHRRDLARHAEKGRRGMLQAVPVLTVSAADRSQARSACPAASLLPPAASFPAGPRIASASATPRSSQIAERPPPQQSK